MALVLLLIVLLIAILTSKLKTRKQYEINKVMRLFPHWAKYIGVVISLFSLTINWIYSKSPTVISSFWEFGLTIGLLIICLSKEKVEDEMTMSIRLNSVFISFFGGIMAHIIFVLIERLYGNINPYNSLYVTNYILFLYIFYFHMKRKSIHEWKTQLESKEPFWISPRMIWPKRLVFRDKQLTPLRTTSMFHLQFWP